MLCSSADVLESKCLVQVAITVVELAKANKSGASSTNGSLASTPTSSPNQTMAATLAKQTVPKIGGNGSAMSVAKSSLNGGGGGPANGRTVNGGGGGGGVSTIVQQTTSTVMSSNGRETTTRTLVNSRKVIASSNKTT